MMLPDRTSGWAGPLRALARRVRPATRLLPLLVVLAASSPWGCSSGLPDESELRTAPAAKLATLQDELAGKVHDDPEDAEALRLLALTELRRGLSAAAVKHARQATRLEPFEAANHRVLGEAFEADGAGLRAEAAYEQALALAPDHLPTYLRQARLQARLNERDKALRTLDRLLAREPEAFEAGVLKAELLEAREELPEAEEAIRRARTLRPRDEGALRLHVEILRRQGRVDAAIRLAEQGLGFAPDARDLLDLLLRMHRGRGDWAAAQGALERLEALGPLTAAQRLLEVEVRFGLGRDASAQEALDTLVRQHPDFAPAYVRLAERRLRAGKLRDALDAARRAVALDPRLAEAQYWVAAASFLLGDRATGEAALEAAEKAAPKRPAVRLLRVARMLAERRLDAAGEALEQIAADAPGVLAVHLFDSERLALRGNLDAAEQELLRLPPDFAPDHVRFARLRIAYLRGQWAKVTELAPPLSAHPLLGWRAIYLHAAAMLQLGRWPEGAKVLAPLLEGSQRRVEFVYLAGYLKLLQGDRQGARRTFLSGKALAPGSPLITEALSRMAMDAQDWAQARSLLEEGLKAPGPYRDVFLDRLGRVGQGLRSAELTRDALVNSLATRYLDATLTAAGPAAAALNGSYLPDYGRLGGR